MPDNEPYRSRGESTRPIKELMEIIEAEKKIGIPLPENAGRGTVIKELGDLKDMNSLNKYKDIAFYSSRLGVLRLDNNNEFVDREIASIAERGTKVFLDWTDETENTTLTIRYNPVEKNFTVDNIERSPTTGKFFK